MQLAEIMERVEACERRAAALYRTFAARSRSDPALCALWTTLAREEEDHARRLAAARERTDVTDALRTRVEGWDETLTAAEQALDAAEALRAGADLDAHLSAALDLELTELDALRHALLAASGHGIKTTDEGKGHADRLAHVALARSGDGHVRMLATLLLARARLGAPATS